MRKRHISEKITTEIKLRPLLTKGLHLVGSMLRNKTNEYKKQLLENLANNMWKHFENGTIKISIYKVLDIKDAEEAHRILLNNENVGKVVLKVK